MRGSQRKWKTPQRKFPSGSTSTVTRAESEMDSSPPPYFQGSFELKATVVHITYHNVGCNRNSRCQLKKVLLFLRPTLCLYVYFSKSQKVQRTNPISAAEASPKTTAWYQNTAQAGLETQTPFAKHRSHGQAVGRRRSPKGRYTQKDAVNFADR